ncbi:MAG TPA: transglycosylase domain-containing protein [Candidatus Limnocylindrales bacterium]|nr:transglycosylase domain-containing protein [Candidatus Limnocylindrales bacterium]
MVGGSEDEAGKQSGNEAANQAPKESDKGSGKEAAPVVGRARVPSRISEWTDRLKLPKEWTDKFKVPKFRGQASVPQAARGVATVPGQAKPAKPAVPPEVRERRKRKRRRRTILGIALSVVVLLSGVMLIGGSYFYDSVPRPSELTLANNTEVYSSDGKTQIARLGTQNRTEVDMTKIPDEVRKALIAGEDKKFFEHHGIDLWGIGRAAYNNLTGGDRQGASTITQQYARAAANDMEISYARKLREAVMARKLEDEYDKLTIMGFYLNTVYFGRGAYGVGAAAEAYFGIPPERIETMTTAQAAVLGAVLKQPEPDGAAKGYDPQNDPEAARDRWNYVLNNMVEMRWLTPEKRVSLNYPKVEPFDAAKGFGFGYVGSGTGYVINYIARELDQRGVIAWLKDNRLGNWKSAGLRITTTIDPRVQKAMEAELNRTVPGSTMSRQKENMIGAGVAIDPANGRVLAYYGGTNNGNETDWAGYDQPHPPASSFKIYTLAAAIADGISVQSHWNSRELKKSNGDKYDLTNASRESDPGCDTYCTLESMTLQSFNVPFFRITEMIGTQKVIGMANRAGIRTMWTDKENKPYNLDKGIPGLEAFFYYAGIGQYPIAVIDHAVGTATIANHGVRNDAHFVLKVERRNRKTGKWEHLSIGDEKLGSVVAMPASVADEVTSVLKQVPTGVFALDGGQREAAGKTGSWENAANPKTNAHVWFTGYTPQIASTIWLGSKDINATPIKTPEGANMGSVYPKGVWARFMDAAHKELNLPHAKLATGSGGTLGDVERGSGISPTPLAPPPPSPIPSATVTPTTSPSPTRRP